jgi:hypothetical protein
VAVSSTSFGQPNANPHGKGRTPGVPEKHTRILRQAAILAAEIAGGGGKDGLVNYLVKQAHEHPVAFMGFLGKAMPLQIDTDGDSRIIIEVVRGEYHPSDDAKLINGKANGHTDTPAK